jgi:hypothetical protein
VRDFPRARRQKKTCSDRRQGAGNQRNQWFNSRLRVPDFFNFISAQHGRFIAANRIKLRTAAYDAVYQLISEMRTLLQQIKRELRRAKHCAIYKEELSRVWPENGKRREAQIAQFAQDHGLRVRYYRDGFCAIFDRPPRKRRQR